MTNSWASKIPPDQESFQRFRFEIFRPFSIRLGFLIALLSLLSHLPDWLIRPEAAISWAPTRLLLGVLLTIYPLAILKNVPRPLLPWILYTSILVAMLARLKFDLSAHDAQLGNIWTLFYYFICPWILGLSFHRRENIIGILTLLLIPNLIGLINQELMLMAAKIDLMIAPLIVFLFYAQHHVDMLIKSLYDHQNKLNHLANRDALTGLFNRRHFFEFANLIIKRAKRSKSSLCLLVFDIDHFKSINDEFGHMAGDAVIRETAKILLETLRETDLIARLGGEEFVALLADADRSTGTLAAERARTALGKAVLPTEKGSPIRFTASVGVAVMRPEGEALEDILDRADQGLYSAKRNGRNRVVYQECLQT